MTSTLKEFLTNEIFTTATRSKKIIDQEFITKMGLCEKTGNTEERHNLDKEYQEFRVLYREIMEKIKKAY